MIYVYENANFGSRNLGMVRSGDMFNLKICSKDNFVPIHGGGWLSLSQVRISGEVNSSEISTQKQLHRVRSNNYLVPIRQQPNGNSRVVGFLSQDNIILLKNNRYGSWREVDGGGWVDSTLINLF
jgi:hypothetical protein